MTTFVMVDTLATLRRIATLPQSERDTAILQGIVHPFEGMFAAMRWPGAGDERSAYLAAARGWEMAPPDGANEAYLAELDRLEQAHAPDAAREALERADAAFARVGVSTRIDTVRVGVFPFHPNSPAIAQSRGYTGFGAIAGFIALTLWPDEYTLPRIGPAAAHEFNHQARFQYQPFRPDISVGEYTVAEGLAESFAASLFGEELIGPWVTEHTPEAIERAKAIIGAALHVRGFDTVRGYVFGDPQAERAGRPTLGLPSFAGYAVGYHLVQAYLRSSGRTAAEATVIPAAEIIAQAGYF